MKDVHDIFREAAIESGKNIFFNKRKEEGNDGLAFILTLLLFVGSEGVKIIFRKGFGRNGLNMGMIIGCFLCLGGISAYCFYSASNPEQQLKNKESAISYLVTGLLFSCIGLYIVVRGVTYILSALKASDLSDNPGKAFLLNFLKKDRWDDDQIKYIAEPSLILCLGIGYSFFNLLGGVAFMIMAISVWGRAVIEIIILGNPILQRLNNKSNRISGSKSNNRVK